MDLSARADALVLLLAAAVLLGAPLLLTRFLQFPSPRLRRAMPDGVLSPPALPAPEQGSDGAVVFKRPGPEDSSLSNAQGVEGGRLRSYERPLFIHDRRTRRSGRSPCLGPFTPAMAAVWRARRPRELAIVAWQHVELTTAIALAANKLSLELPESVLAASRELDGWALEHADPE
jgi:hypothetical protein